MKRILITGATGFIGRFLVAEALRRGYDPMAAVRQTSKTGHLDAMRLPVVTCDFSAGGRLNDRIRSLPRFDYVIHNAGVTKSLDRHEYFQVNAGNTGRLADALLQTGRIPDKFLLMSSLAAFGPGDSASGEPILRTATPRPVTAYGESKLAAERILAEKGLPYMIIRPTAVYGPGERDIFEAIKLIRHGVALQAGRKNQRLTFMYVKDLARLVFDALESPHVNRAYFAADGNLYGSRDLGRIVAMCLGGRVTHVALPVWLVRIIAAAAEPACRMLKKAPVLNRDKVHELAACNWNCDVEPLRAELNFRSEYDLARGMRETIDWYRREKWLR